jgi:cytochrome c oxidase subunit III
LPTTAAHTRYIIHPYKFNLWIAITSMVMMFAAFTSAYVVKKGDVKYWQEIQLPHIFIYSTITIIVSSLCMHLAYTYFKKNNMAAYRGWLVLTFLLGITFVVLQFSGWEQLVHSGVILKGNVAGSFIYVISGAHVVHVVGGVIALLVFTILSFTKKNGIVTENSDRVMKVEVLATYWHFVDILWVYLFIFLLLNN